MKFQFYAFKLTAVIVLVFLAQTLFSGFTEMFVLNGSAFSGEIWRFLTAVFLHGGVGHLLFNGFALALFGSILERFIGGVRFLIVFFVTGILANLISVNFYSSSLGASGAIFGVIGALIIVRPGLTVWAFGMPMPMFLAGIFWAVGDLIGAYGFFVGNPINNTGNLAHLSGMFFGIIFGVWLRGIVRRGTKRRNVSIDENSVRVWEDFHMR